MKMDATLQNTVTKAQLIAAIAAMKKPRSAWGKGVKAYAEEMLDSLEVEQIECSKLEAELLAGARNWQESSDGGSHLIYDAEIAARLCSPYELKKCKGGELQPSSRETWLECQARALSQAARVIAGFRMKMFSAENRIVI